MITARFTLARTVLTLLMLAAVPYPVHARFEWPEQMSTLGYELGDALIPEITIAEVEPNVVDCGCHDAEPPPPVSQRQFVLPEHALFQNPWKQSQRWTDELWLSSQWFGERSHRPVNGWDDVFNQEVCHHVALRLQRGMTATEVEGLMAGYWQKRRTNVVNGLIRFQLNRRQEDSYLLDDAWLIVRFEDGHVRGFELRRRPHQSSEVGFQF